MRTHLLPAVCALALPAIAAAQGPATGPMPADHPPLAGAEPRRASGLDPQAVVARVNGAAITAGDLDAVIYAPGLPDRLEYLTPDGLRELVEALVDRKLMAAAARAAGMGEGEAPSPQSDLALADAWLARRMSTIAPPDDQAIERHYRENAVQFTVPARVRVTRAISASEQAAGRLREAMVKGATAAQLRALPSARPERVSELWLQDAPKKDPLTAAALALGPGGVSQPLAVPAGFAVLRVEERMPARLRPLPEVRPGIVASLEEQARRQALADVRLELRGNAQVVIDRQVLSAYLPAANPPPPTLGP